MLLETTSKPALSSHSSSTETMKRGKVAWEEMSSEVMGVVFSKLPADEVMRSVAFVCRSWRDAVFVPYGWSDVDLQQWCRRVNRSDVVDRAVRKLVGRCGGSLKRLSASCISDSSLLHVALCTKFMRILQIPNSEVTDDTVEKYAQCLSTLEVVDISYCLRITHKGIEALGSHCKSLIKLRRNMPPPEPEIFPAPAGNSKVDDSEALAISNTMPALEHLEMCYGRLSDVGLDAILTMCGNLRVLDIRGCWSVQIEDTDIENKCSEIKDFKEPWYDLDYDLGLDD